MTNIEFVNKAIEVAVAYKTVYANGMYGFPLDRSAVDRAAAVVPKWYSEDRRQKLMNLYGKGYFGFDCVCLIKGILWGWDGNSNDQNGGAVHGSNGVPDQGETYFNDSKEGGYEASENFTNIVPGEFLYYISPNGNTHCGIYIGDGLAVECTSEWDACVQITAVKNIGSKSGYHERTWKSHKKLPYISYVSESVSSGPLQLDKRVYNSGERIQARVNALASGYTNAWVGLYRSDSGSNFAGNSLGMWQNVYSGGRTAYLNAEKLDVDKNIPYALPAGNYRVVLFQDQGYTKLAEVGCKIQSAQVCEAQYANGWVEATIHGCLMEGAWVGIYPKDAYIYDSAHTSQEWRYIPSDSMNQTSCRKNYFTRIRIPFRQGNAGAYKVVLFSDSGYTKASEKGIDVISMHKDVTVPSIPAGSSGAKLTVTSGAAYSGQNIDINFYGITSKDAWVGLYPYRSDGNYSTCSTGMWCYTATGQQWGIGSSDSVVRNGSVRLRANVLDVDTGTMRYLAPGTYQVVLFNSGGYTVYAKSDPFTISAPVLSLASASLTSGTYQFKYRGAPCYNSWIGIYDKYESDYRNSRSIAWSRVGDTWDGQVTLKCSLMPSKYYKAALFVNSGDEGAGGETYKAVKTCEFLVPYN